MTTRTTGQPDRVATRGKTVPRVPKMPSLAPNYKHIDVHEPPENGTTKFNGSSSCRTNTSCLSDTGVVLARLGWWWGGDSNGDQNRFTQTLEVVPMAPACAVGFLQAQGGGVLHLDRGSRQQRAEWNCGADLDSRRRTGPSTAQRACCRHSSQGSDVVCGAEHLLQMQPRTQR